MSLICIFWKKNKSKIEFPNKSKIEFQKRNSVKAFVVIFNFVISRVYQKTNLYAEFAWLTEFLNLKLF